MWRFLAGAVAALLLAGAGVLLFGKRQPSEAALLAAPAPPPQAGQAADVLPDTVPEASPRTREQKRFGRYDKDRDGKVTREEYLASRHKAFARLDTNGDGRLSFEEWSAKTLAKFAAADADRSGAMNPAEFATTAVKRKPKAVVKCPPVGAAKDDEG